MSLLALGFLLLSIVSLEASARPSLNTTTTNDDFDVSCFRESENFPAISYEACEPLIAYLESFTDVFPYSPLDFPQTYHVREAPRCLVIISTGRVKEAAFEGSEFGTAARRVLTECESRPPQRGYAFGGFVSFRPRWFAEVRGLDTRAGTNQTPVMHPSDVAVD